MLTPEKKHLIAQKTSSNIVDVEPLTGGDINAVYLIKTDREDFVLKVNKKEKYPEMLVKEFRALAFLADKSTLKYPTPFLTFEDGEEQFLTMEYVQQGLTSSNGINRLGEGLALQHKNTNTHFGWEENNFIGSLPQKNSFISTWGEFYAENRLLFQSKMAFDKGLLNSTVLRQIEHFCSKIDEIFPTEPPALLHGDLWGGNYFIDEHEIPTLYDPAVYFGHREIDIAMTRLFGGFSDEFYKSYHSHYPLEKGWEIRIPYGQLYPNLVHLNLFGVGYISAITGVVKAF
ncbi:MAG: fructosamine kinase family protein [Brumimicrobium sp.]